MIKVSVLYENAEGSSFDTGYYLGTHIPMVKEKLGAACRGVEVDQGLGSAQPGSKPAFVAMAHLLFDSVDAFKRPSGRTRMPSSTTFRTTPIFSRSFR